MKLQGAINFRDMGGLPTQDGRRLKKNKFYRSGALATLTPEDCQTMQSLAIREIVDYRDPIEAQKDQDILWEGANYECCPANPSSHPMTASVGELFTEQRLISLPSDYMENLYRALPIANPAYKKLFQKVNQLQEGALLQHCAVGKDRTGVGAALLLTSLGVKEDAVLEDYLMTQVGLQPFRLQVMSKIEHLLSSEAIKRFEYMMSARESFYHAAFDEIKNRYGTVEIFFEKEFDLSSEKRATLQKRFLE